MTALIQILCTEIIELGYYTTLNNHSLIITSKFLKKGLNQNDVEFYTDMLAISNDYCHMVDNAFTNKIYSALCKHAGFEKLDHIDDYMTKINKKICYDSHKAELSKCAYGFLRYTTKCIIQKIINVVCVLMEYKNINILTNKDIECVIKVSLSGDYKQYAINLSQRSIVRYKKSIQKKE